MDKGWLIRIHPYIGDEETEFGLPVSVHGFFVIGHTRAQLVPRRRPSTSGRGKRQQVRASGVVTLTKTFTNISISMFSVQLLTFVSRCLAITYSQFCVQVGEVSCCQVGSKGQKGGHKLTPTRRSAGPTRPEVSRSATLSRLRCFLVPTD